MTVSAFLKQAASVKPSRRQLDWFDTEFYGFVHFSPNTFTGREWGLGDEDPAIFNPTKLDAGQWVEAMKSAGMKGLVLTAKHHDGFCLWPSKYTGHSVKNSPYKGGKGDIVAEVAQACREGGLKFGFYLSPWDRNCPYYGTDRYNDYYKAQLTELLTQYGEIFHVWFDGACGEGPNGRRQEYDFEGYIRLIRQYQPNATIFNDRGPDVRWIGNEAGEARTAEWAVVPSELVGLAPVQTGPGPLPGDLSHMYNSDRDIGFLSNILYSKGLAFVGSEVDMSIRKGWFYHPEEEPHSLERLFNTYLNSVGANACFHLNVPPTPEGLFDPRDVQRLKELGDKLRSSFAQDLTASAQVEYLPVLPGETQCRVDITFPQPVTLRYLTLAEDIAQGQRVESFVLMKKDDFGQWKSFYAGSCIGHKKICRLTDWDGSEGVTVDQLRVFVTAARDQVQWRQIAAY